eukprot:5626945-Alexandrium_andersonii.AAC.1
MASIFDGPKTLLDVETSFFHQSAMEEATEARLVREFLFPDFKATPTPKDSTGAAAVVEEATVQEAPEKAGVTDTPAAIVGCAMAAVAPPEP